jgi:hypothetical protein
VILIVTFIPITIGCDDWQVYELPHMRGAFNPLVLLGLGAYPIYRAAVKITENFFFKVARGACGAWCLFSVLIRSQLW